MNLKNAIQTVNVELNKIKNEVGQWHTDREKVFKELKTVWQAEYEKVMDNSQKKPKDIALNLKAFEKFNNKTIDVYTKKILSVNAFHTPKIKGIPKSLSDMVEPYLKTVKESYFGVGVKAKDAIEQDLNQWIMTECYKEFDAQPSVNQLNKKLSLVTKDFTKTTRNEAEHLMYMAKIDLFTSKMLESVNTSYNLSKSTRKGIEYNDLTHSMLYELEVRALSTKVNETLYDVLNVSSKELNAFVKSYGTSADESSLARSKLAMKGVKGSFSDFKRDFEDSILEDMDSSSMNSMYLNDMRDHLNLGKACLINDCVAMEKGTDMDTASRELISDSLYNYLSSDKFNDKLTEQNKIKKKLKV